MVNGPGLVGSPSSTITPTVEGICPVPGIQCIESGVKMDGLSIELANATVPPASNAAAATANANCFIETLLKVESESAVVQPRSSASGGLGMEPLSAGKSDPRPGAAAGAATRGRD